MGQMQKEAFVAVGAEKPDGLLGQRVGSVVAGREGRTRLRRRAAFAVGMTAKGLVTLRITLLQRTEGVRPFQIRAGVGIEVPLAEVARWHTRRDREPRRGSLPTTAARGDRAGAATGDPWAVRRVDL
jgi:hypothetical protein